MRALVCGGRDYNDWGAVATALESIFTGDDQPVVITGGARGADFWAERWAQLNGIACLVYRAEWSKHGKAAGPIRNQRMLDEGKPDLVVAFPGGRGTADMVKRAIDAGVRVREIGDPE